MTSSANQTTSLTMVCCFRRVPTTSAEEVLAHRMLSRSIPRTSCHRRRVEPLPAPRSTFWLDISWLKLRFPPTSSAGTNLTAQARTNLKSSSLSTGLASDSRKDWSMALVWWAVFLLPSRCRSPSSSSVSLGNALRLPAGSTPTPFLSIRSIALS